MSAPQAAADRFADQHGAMALLSKGGLGIAIAVVCLFGAVSYPGFLSVTNFVNIFNSMSIVGIIVVGMTFVLIVGGLADLSVPATVACGAILALALQPMLGAYGAFFVAIAIAGACGVLTGVLVGYVGINPIIASLAVGSIVIGGVQAAVGGVIIYNEFPEASELLKGKLLGIPIVVLIFFLVAALGHFVLSRSYLGRWVYATGGNIDAARASAVPVRKVRAIAFIITALCAGLSGALLGLTLQSARPLVGIGYEFSAITAVVIGGTSILGGVGSIPRAVAGLIFVQLLINVMILQGIPSPIQGFFLGLLIVLAVALDVFLRQKSMAA